MSPENPSRRSRSRSPRRSADTSERPQPRRRRNKWGDENEAPAAEAPPAWVLEAVSNESVAQPPAYLQGPILARAQAPTQVSKEMEIPSAVMGHVIGPKGATVSNFRTTTGVHVQVIVCF